MSRHKPTLLLIDDLPIVRLQFREILRHDFEIIDAGTAHQALDMLSHHWIDLIVLDLMMPDVTGLELFYTIRNQYGAIPLLIATASDDPKSVLDCLKSGAKDYLFKEDLASHPEKLIQTIQQVLAHQEQQDVAKSYLDMQKDKSIYIPPVLPYTDCFNLALQAIKGDFSLVILGETGVGKGTLVHYIHTQLMSKKPLITVNCGAICASLAEAELFGSEQGAYTGSTERRKGKLELAHGGILFLDEITNLSYELQGKLLCALETKKITRVGGNNEISTQFILITATNRHLETEVQEGRFRVDLYYRINQFSVELPALRYHPELTRSFLDYYLEFFNKKYKTHVQLSSSEMQFFLKNPWIGNVRELKNELQKYVWLCSLGHSYETAKLPQKKIQHASFQDNLDSIEHKTIQDTLHKHKYNITAAARELGLHRSTLQGKLRKFKLYPIRSGSL